MTVRLLGILLFALCLAPETMAQEKRYPPPELGPDYVEPTTAFPALREVLPPMLDVVVLVLAIALASHLALRRRSRGGILLLSIAALAWFGFVREGCVCPVGSLQNVTQSLADSTAPILTATILFFVVPLISTLLVGRSFCAAVCPLGAIQELLLLRPTNLPGWLAAGLSLLPVVYLALTILYAVTDSAYVICRYDPFVGLFRMGATINMMVVGGCLVLISVFVGRPYCRFLCPYGVLLGWASKLSWRRITITPDICTNCRLCEGVCPYGAITEPNAEAVAQSRFRGRGALLGVLALMPVLVLGLGWSAAGLGPMLATGNARVALAEQIQAEESGLVRETTDASDVFRASGETIEALLADADAIRGDFVLGSWILGGFVGLVIALRLIGLSIRRTRREYEADRELCMACARCYQWCPVEQERRGILPEGST